MTGIDAAEENIRVASAHVEEHNDPAFAERLQYRCMSAEQLVEEGVQFDAVVASEVIEHVVDPAEFVSTCVQLTAVRPRLPVMGRVPHPPPASNSQAEH